MAISVSDPGDEYVLNYCAKHLSRASHSPQPGDDDGAAKFRAGISEAWRFPIIGLVRDREVRPDTDDGHFVTFVYKLAPKDQRPVQVVEPWQFDAMGRKAQEERMEKFFSVDYVDLHILKNNCGIGLHPAPRQSGDLFPPPGTGGHGDGGLVSIPPTGAVL